jgi:hypothetical protein
LQSELTHSGNGAGLGSAAEVDSAVGVALALAIGDGDAADGVVVGGSLQPLINKNRSNKINVFIAIACYVRS